MRDFTLIAYRSLLTALLNAGYQFQTFEQFLGNPKEGKTVVLRHDVDEKAYNALKMARLEHELGIRATYFFRIVIKSNVPEVIQGIAALGHEIGYHYEDLALAEGDMEKAIDSFEKHLAYFRGYYPVRSVCMHGSSASEYDNRLLWQTHDLSSFGLMGEPYLSVDFEKVYYLTDTGLAWDGGRFSVRDVVENHFGLQFHSTQEVVACIGRGDFPERALILAHTLWTDNFLQWHAIHLREFFRNRLKRMSKNSKVLARIYKKMVRAYWK